MRTINKTILALSLTACYSAAFADVKPGTPTLGDVLAASGVSVTGYVDTSYNYLTGSGVFTGNGYNDRVFDFDPHTFEMNMVQITASSLPASGFGGLASLNFGPNADTVAAAGVNNTKEVQQAYVQYANGPLSIMGGKYVTLAGAEVIDSTANTNSSRSILFGYAIPFAHTGVRVTYAPIDTIKFMAGIVNGWDNQRDNNVQKTLELGFAATPIKPLSLTGALYDGTEQTTVGSGNRTLLDLVATFNASDVLSVAANVDYGRQENAVAVGSTANWDGIAGYVNFTLNPLWRISGRAEYFNDKDGYRTGVNSGAGGQKWTEATVTLAYMPMKNVEFRGEVRSDKSNASAFMYTNGTVKKTQSSLALEGIYKF